MLAYVTGMAGVGKSAVCRELTARGLLARDIDDGVFRAWHHRDTGALLEDQPVWAETTVEWREDHWLLVQRPAVVRLAEQARGGVAFLCGTCPNEKDVWDLFDLVVFLVVSDATLAARLAARTDNTYGKHSSELADILAWNADAAARSADLGAALIDAEPPLDIVCDAVVHAAGRSSPAPHDRDGCVSPVSETG